MLIQVGSSLLRQRNSISPLPPVLTYPILHPPLQLIMLLTFILTVVVGLGSNAYASADANTPSTPTATFGNRLLGKSKLMRTIIHLSLLSMTANLAVPCVSGEQDECFCQFYNKLSLAILLYYYHWNGNLEALHVAFLCIITATCLHIGHATPHPHLLSPYLGCSARCVPLPCPTVWLECAGHQPVHHRQGGAHTHSPSRRA